LAHDGTRAMNSDDAFLELAPYYDRIMDHVNYDRWYMITMAVAGMLSPSFTHLDAACGTGTLIKRLRAKGWKSLGTDVSYAMIRAGRKAGAGFPAAAADLRALPMCGVDYVTCLFDSVNFLLTIEDVTRSFMEIRRALSPQGIFYFDIVTERMVTEHFEDQDWSENNGRFSTKWRSRYSRKTNIAETTVKVENGPEGTVRERIYTQAEIEQAIDSAGLYLLGVFDAHTWKPPHKRTVRIDFVAARDNSRALRKRFESVYAEVRGQFT